MAESPTDVQPVLDAVAKLAARLCHAPFARVFVTEGDQLRPVAFHSVHGESAIAVDAMPLRRTSISARAMLDRATIHHADVVPLLDTEYPSARENAMAVGFRAVLAVPLMGKVDSYGALFLWRLEPQLFAPDQVALVETFATQAAIAIENVRRFHGTQEALEQQTATSEILRVISSSPSDVQPVFDTIAANALRLCDARRSAIFRFDGNLIHLAAHRNLNPEGADALRNAYPAPPGRGSPSRRAVLTGAIVHIADVIADPEYEHRNVALAADFRSVLSVPMLRDGCPIGAITVYRDVATRFPDTQVELLKTFADQAVIAIENVRLFTELEVRNRDLTEALEQQTATSEILRVISSSPTDAQPVFDTIAANALRLCDAEFSALFRFDGEQIHIGAFQNMNPQVDAAFRSAYPCRPNRGGATQRAILTRRIVHIPDISADPEYTYQNVAENADFHSALSVPMLRDGTPIGTISVYRVAASPFPDSQIELLKTFADQAVIAIENVRLFNETKEALDRQTATGEILRVISSSPTDTQPIFEAIVESAMQLCNPVYSAAVRLEGELIHLVAHRNWSGEGLAMARRLFPMPLNQDHLTAHAIRESRIIHLHNLQSDPNVPASSRELAIAQGYQTLLIVPMLREGRAIGAIVVANAEAPFSEKPVLLLQTFADQAVIAIENVRLFKELEVRNRDLTEALEQQTATSEILRVISRSQTDVQPVFDTIVGSVRALCDATFSGVYLLDGETLSLAAAEGMNPDDHAAFAAGYPRKIGPDTVSGLAALECRVVQTPDLISDPAFSAAPGSRVGARTVLGVPLMRGNRAIGSIGVWRAEVIPFSDTQIALLQTFADQAVIAIENVRLFKELEARTTQLTRSVGELRALGDVGQAVSSTLDLETVLSTIVSRATELSGMAGGAIYEYDAAREEFYLHTTHTLPDELVAALRATPIKRGEGALGALAVTGEPVQVQDIMDEGVYQSSVRKILIRSGHRSLLAVPLLREDRLLGGLVVNRKTAGEFAPEVIDLLKTFATQSALAIQNAQLFREIEVKGRQLEIASQHKSEFLANMSHELRTPLNAIIGFSEVLAERLFGELNEKQAEYARDITESGRHLLSLINEILDLSKIEAGRMELELSEFDLATTINNTLSLVRERAERRGIALRCALDAGVTTIHADERKVKQVLLNLLSNALKFTPEGGAIDVRASASDGQVEIAVTDTGVGIAEDELDAVFEEFRQVGSAARKIEGTGLGLAISRKFIELHGGKIWVTSKLGAGSTFTFTLPRQ